jgi:hypothetical protein
MQSVVELKGLGAMYISQVSAESCRVLRYIADREVGRFLTSIDLVLERNLN